MHVKQKIKSGSSGDSSKYIYVPGRIVKAGKSGFDCECYDGDVVVRGVVADDVVVGIEDGASVEAKRPEKSRFVLEEIMFTCNVIRCSSSLECTGVSWSCSGSVLAASFGKSNITGWCTMPGAVCVWTSVFSRGFQPDEVI